MNTSPYSSGWCTTCGRRRGNDGRCINCDPWWTSPLIQVGGPILAVGSLLLVGLSIAVTPPRPDPAAQSAQTARPPALLSSPTLPLSASLGPAPLSPPPAPQAVPPLATIPQLPPEFYAPKPPPDAALMADFEWLQYRVRVASGQMRIQSDTSRQRERFTPLNMQQPEMSQTAYYNRAF